MFAATWHISKFLKLAATATAVTNGVAKDAVIYFNAWWLKNLAIALAVAAPLDTA